MSKILDPYDDLRMKAGYVIPLGTIVDEESKNGNYCWGAPQNEYVVYKESQVQLRYLVQLDRLQ